MGSAAAGQNDAPTMTELSSTNDLEDRRRKGLRPSFSPYARVLAIECRNELSEKERVDTWWQDDDYDAFRKATARVVKLMLNENINGWLGIQAKIENNRSIQPPPAPVVASDQCLMSSPKRHLPDPVDQESDPEVCEPASQKTKRNERNDVEASSWWLQYGDVACFHEARKRQTHAKRSIGVVLSEQRSQRMTKSHDVGRIRSSYIGSSSWASDWAMALAAAHAEEVRREVHGGSCNEETLASLHRMKENLTSLNGIAEATVLRRSLQNHISSVCTSQIRYRYTASAGPIKGGTKP